MKKLFNKKGFTLAELLIVVAIIAVLVAIAIPVFTGAVEKAGVTADAANIRAAYAQLQIAAIDAASVNAANDVTTFKAQSSATLSGRTISGGGASIDLPAEVDTTTTGAISTLTKGSQYDVSIAANKILIKAHS